MDLVEEAVGTMTKMSDAFIKPAARLIAAVFAAWPAPATAARAQQVVVIVNGEPITALDIEQRIKLTQISTHKAPPRQEVLDELIDEKLKVREAKKWGLEIPDTEVDHGLRHHGEPHADDRGPDDANAGQVGYRPQHPQNSHPRRHHLVAARARALPVEPADRREGRAHRRQGRRDGRLRLHAAPDPVHRGARIAGGGDRGAQAQSGGPARRFKGCEEGIPFVRALKDVAVRDQVIRSSADLPPELRKVLEGIEVGQLTAPEVTKLGVEMFAICAKKESSAENSPGKRQARESIFAQRFEQRSKQYLQNSVAAR